MAIENGKALIRRFNDEVWGKGNLDVVYEVFAPDYVRHDLRPLVLKTILTYLELDGVLKQGTPFYAGYRLRPLGEASLEEVCFV